MVILSCRLLVKDIVARVQSFPPCCCLGSSQTIEKPAVLPRESRVFLFSAVRYGPHPSRFFVGGLGGQSPHLIDGIAPQCLSALPPDSASVQECDAQGQAPQAIRRRRPQPGSDARRIHALASKVSVAEWRREPLVVFGLDRVACTAFRTGTAIRLNRRRRATLFKI